jgi:type VI secretion system Hcp family effector
MKTSTTLFIALLLLASVTFSFAQGIFVELTAGPTNGSVPVTGEFLLTSAQYNFVRPTGGNVQATPLMLTKLVDGASPSLLAGSFTGSLYNRIRINYYRTGAGGTRELVYRVSVGMAFVNEYTGAGAQACASGCPGINESVSITYRQITIADYTQSPARVTGYDFARSQLLTTEL